MAMGSHTGSFAGGFIKSFLAVAQMAMRKRQLDDMHAFYGVMMQQMKANMLHQQKQDDQIDRFTHGITPWKGSAYDTSGTGDTTGKYKIADMTKMAEKAGFKGEDAPHMAAIAAAESNGNPDAVGKAGEVGLTQINPHDWSAEDVKTAGDPQGAFNVAYKVFQKQGWGAWSTDPSSQNFTPKNSMEKFFGTARDAAGIKGTQASAIDTRDSSQAKTFLASVSAHPDRPGDTSNMQPEFATRMAASIKQANAEGIPARLESGFREPGQLLAQGDRSKAAYFDARGESEHSKGNAGDVAGIGTAGSPTARRWAEIASANGLAVPYGYDNGKEFNHTELAGLTHLRGAQPVNASRSMVAGPGVGDSSNTLPPSDLKPDQFATGGPELAAATAPVPPVTAAPTTAIPIGGGAGNVLTQAPGGPQLPNQATPAAAPAAPAAPIPARGAPPVPLGPAPGTVQSNVGGVRGQQPGAGGPIYTVGQFGQPPQPTTQPVQPAQPAPALPARTGMLSAPMPPPDPRTGQRPQQVPPNATPLPPPRPANLSGESDTSGNIIPATAPGAPSNTGVNQDVGSLGGGPTGDPLWAGYQGASPDQAASADPLNNLYASGQNFAAESGLTDTSGLMAMGQMTQMASMDDTDLTAEMYRGGPVIRYQRGGVINRYAEGGDTDDMLAEYGGTDTEDPMANAYWDQMRVNAQLTNNSGPTGGSDLTTSIQNRAQLTPQEQQQIQIPPAPDTSIGEPPTSAQSTPADQSAAAPTTEQPAAPASEDTTAPQPTSQSDIPPGSVQVAGPGGWGSVGRGGPDTGISLPRVGGMGGMGGGMRMPHPSMSMLTGGRGGRTANAGKLGNQPLYTPSSVSDEDYNHLGLAPVHNSDGTASPWLLNMLDNGIRSLFTGFGLANQGAIPGSPESKQNLIAFGQHPGVDKEDMDNLGDFVDPKHQLYEGGRDIAGAVGMIKYYALTGQLDAASRLSGGVLLYTRMMSMQYGDQAVKDLFGGDYKNAVKSLEKGYNWVPDAKTAEATDIDTKTGKVHAVQKDGNGNVIAEQDYLPAAIMKAALGLKDGTGFWNMLSSVARAGGNDPMGSHYETQRMLRQIQGNEHVPPGPLASQAAPKTTPDSAAPPASPDTTITSPDTTQPTPDTQPAPTTASPTDTQAAQPPTTAPPIPDRNVGPNQNVGQAAPPPTAQPPQAMASRGDTVPPNLVAGPGASSTIQPQPVSTGGSGATLVAQEQARAEQAKQSQAIDRMVHGGAFDGDDPYVQQKITDIQNRNIVPLQTQRTQMEQQFADIEGADISPAEKRSLQVALQGKIKNFDETKLKPAIAIAKQEYSQFSSGLKQQFQAKMQLVKRQEKLQDEALKEEQGQIAGQIKYREPRNMDDEQFNLIDGIDKNGRQIIDPSTNERIYGFGDSLNMPPEAVRSVATGVDANGKTTSSLPVPINPLVNYSKNGNPYLSSSFDGKNPDTFNFHDIKTPEGQPLYTTSTMNTMVDASKDVLKYDKGTDARMVKDFVTGAATGTYKISISPFNMPRSPLLTNKMAPDVVDENQRMIPSDNVERVNVTISRGPNDTGTTVVMSKNNAFKLQAINQDAISVSRYNKGMIDAKAAPLDRPIPEPEPVRPPPRSANNSQQQPPPIPQREYDRPIQF